MTPRPAPSGRDSPRRQAELPFLRRSRRFDRACKALIVGLTGLALAALIFGTGSGRRAGWRLRTAIGDRVGSMIGIGAGRDEIEARKALRRQLGIEAARRALIEVGEDGGPRMRAFLRAARLDGDSALIRWGNFDRTLALSSAVFEPDDAGRSYRLRPSTRSVWLTRLTIRDVLAMFEIPDDPEAIRLGEAVGGQLVAESVQTTNSWGCRGAEPDLAAPIRVLVLGDSNMQGLLVGDDQTPASRLEVRLKGELGVAVSVLNTGHLGYSPEQYYHTLLAFRDRFRPNFLVISLCANDFGDLDDPADRAESEYWLDAIAQACRTRDLDYLVVPIPLETAMLGARGDTPYPGKLAEIFDGAGLNFLDPLEEFATEELTLRAAALREGRPFLPSPLFNGRHDDHHLSPLGCDLWARIVARRIRLVRDAKPPSAVAPPSRPTPVPKASR